MGSCDSAPTVKSVSSTTNLEPLNKYPVGENAVATVEDETAQRIFSKFDTEQTGQVSIDSAAKLTSIFQEMGDAVPTHASVQKVFALLDKDAVYDTKHFRHLLYIGANAKDNCSIEKLAFLTADRECTGKISPADVEHIMARLGRHVSAENVRRAMRRVGAAEGLNLRQFEELFQFL